jgi:cellulose synthase/poly-beta-1,6-N-acetylglucosamine synthase-like glycosyltransferase
MIELGWQKFSWVLDGPAPYSDYPLPKSVYTFHLLEIILAILLPVIWNALFPKFKLLHLFALTFTILFSSVVYRRTTEY